MTTSKTIANLTERLAAAEAEIAKLREESEHAEAYRFEGPGGRHYAERNTADDGRELGWFADHAELGMMSKAEAITEARRLAGVK